MRTGHVHPYAVPTFSHDRAPAASTAFDHWALRQVRHAVASARIRFVLWDGYEAPSPDAPTIATIFIRNRRALVSWVLDPDLNFGEAYMFGAIDVQGDLEALLEEVYRALPINSVRPWWRRRAAVGVNSARHNVHQHYDLGNDFYKLWLDRELLYTCAYFPDRHAGLEDAQIAKMDRVCQKLRLRPGDRVVEAGCGWGALALFMAGRYGVQVKAFNLSAEQIAWARSQAALRGLASRVEFVEDDYRNVSGKYDVFVSLGMLEHVGVPDYPTLGAVIDRSLTWCGRGLLHFIGRNQPAPLNPWIRRRIFPGAYPPTLVEVAQSVFEPASLSVLDIENLRLHYARTIEHWRARFDRAADHVESMFDDTFVRAWRLYLAGSQAAFATGAMQLFQIVFARASSNAIPWSRDRISDAFGPDGADL